MQTPDDKFSTVDAVGSAHAQFKGSNVDPAGRPVTGPRPFVDGANDAVDHGAQAGEDFVKRLVEGAHVAIDKLADMAGPTVDRIAGAFSNSSEKVSSVGQGRNEEDSWLSDVKGIVREHPVTAVAVALAAGAVFLKLTAPASRNPRDGLDD